MNLTDSQKNKPSLERQASIEFLQFIPGIWVNGKYYWFHNCAEKVIFDEELIVKVKNEPIHSKIRFSSVYVSNHSNHKKEIKVLAMHHYANIKQDNLTFVSPTDNRIFHVADNGVFLVNSKFEGVGMKEYTTIPQWSAYTDQIWSSLHKGSLKYQPMAGGPAASIFAIKMSLEQHETKKMSTWTISGTSKNELISMEQGLLKNTLAFPFEK
ncbi:hypothetical protein ACIFOT_16890 [Neobacillus sp. NRS-1170]|uniref:hypothetical protein n=1 Tax=Neobacillus sp. NRS-1170 TaxID=3233898 RepID=UPI003D29801A